MEQKLVVQELFSQTLHFHFLVKIGGEGKMRIDEQVKDCKEGMNCRYMLKWTINKVAPRYLEYCPTLERYNGQLELEMTYAFLCSIFKYNLET